MSAPTPDVNAALAADAKAMGDLATKTERDLALWNDGLSVGRVAIGIGAGLLGALFSSNPATAPYAPALDVALAEGVRAIDASLAAQKVTIPPESVAALADLAKQGMQAGAPALLAKLGLPADVSKAALPGLTSLAGKAVEEAAAVIDPPQSGPTL